MSIFRTLKFITDHPLNRDQKVNAVRRFINWQLNTRLNSWPVIFPITSKAKLIVKKGMTGATGNVYCGLHDYNDMFFLLHFLRQEDLFIDIGANIGSYTVLASAHCGAKTIAVEPVPSTYELLIDNVQLNRMSERVTALNIALGSAKGTIPFTSSFDTINHVALEATPSTINVEIRRLDEVIGEKMPQLIKIDVEGYETEVLNGSGNVLENPALKAIIIELNGAGSNYGYDERKIHEKLLNAGFLPYQYDPVDRKPLLLDSFGKTNTIYIRDLGFVKERLIHAEKVQVLGKSI